MSEKLEANYIIVGGGLTGCALASRLSQTCLAPSVLLFEAGALPSAEHDIDTPAGGFALQGSTLDWQYRTNPVPETNGRSYQLTAGKTLGGGSVLNYGQWSRGDAADYDNWARLAGHSRWKRGARLQYEFEGPMVITTVEDSDPKRRYPLSGPLRAGWKELGVVAATSGSRTGANTGLTELFENWKEGHRQPAYQAYPLTRVRVHTSSPVSKLLFTANGEVTGVMLRDGRLARAHKEVVLCAGALRSPIILHASGIGPASLLTAMKIPLVQELPAIGAAYFDHFALFQLWKLHPRSAGLSLGHPDLADPAFLKGMPTDFVVNEVLPHNVLKKALDEDGVEGDEQQALLQPGRCFIETLVLSHPMAPGVPIDGSWISTSVKLTLPSSRGSIAVSEHVDQPRIEPNYFSTALDRAALKHGVRRVLELLLKTQAMQPYVAAEVPPPGLQALTSEWSDAEIEQRIQAAGVAHFHAAGSCPVGKALDPELRLHGVRGVRVCDVSIFPSPVGGHPQASLYGVAEMAADLIAKQN